MTSDAMLAFQGTSHTTFDPGIASADDEQVRTLLQHVLRTPLTSIRALAEILLEHPELKPRQRQEFLRIILAESDRLSDAVGWVGEIVDQKTENGGIDD